MATTTPSNSFRIACKQIHLTYKTHLNFEHVLAFIKSIVGDLDWYSICHELGHQQSAEPNASDEDANDHPGYDHTHFAFCCSSKFQSRNQRIFDYGDIHPHIRVIKDKDHASRLFHEYHRKDPVAIFQSETGKEPAPIVPRGQEAETAKRIKRASSLLEAAAIFGITPTSITDIAAIRNEKTRPSPAVHTYPDSVWTLQPRIGWNVLYIWGPSNTGKTAWAVHQFERPLLISDLDELRHFDADIYDGIVFDDCTFDNRPATDLIHLVDWEYQRDIHCRYHNATIPAKTRKIFCHNLHWRNAFGSLRDSSQQEAVQRRFSEVIHVTSKTYATLSPIQAQLTAAAPSNYADTFVPFSARSDMDFEDLLNFSNTSTFL